MVHFEALETDRSNRFQGTLAPLVGSDSVQLKEYLYVAEHRPPRQQSGVLKNKAKPIGLHGYGAGGGSDNSGCDSQECGLSTPRRSYDARELALANRQRDVA
jgi:hypothetical protein